MATTRKRSSAAAAVTKSAIAEASTLLKELPEKPKNNWSLREAVSLLQESITEALDRGYTYEEVAVLLGKQGVSIAAPSLKRYLAAVKRDKGSTRRGGRGKSNKAALEAADLAGVATTLEKAPVAEKAVETAPSKRQSRTSGGTAAKAEPKAAAKKAKATPTATAKTAAEKPAAAKTTTRGRKKSAS
ncbi:hypothetical protein IFO70_06785 [Phormidium tenue FACHB-886]|nr:hypothetical protein [Phormidium tenue FACHB-886]